MERIMIGYLLRSGIEVAIRKNIAVIMAEIITAVLSVCGIKAKYIVTSMPIMNRTPNIRVNVFLNNLLKKSHIYLPPIPQIFAISIISILSNRLIHAPSKCNAPFNKIEGWNFS
jgi:hypothetical protein